MRNAAWLLLSFLCAPAFSQTAPDNNAAAGNMKKRLETLKLLNLPKQLIMNKAPVVCAIPLLVVKPEGNFTMRMMTPPAPAPDRELKLQVPAPACQ